MSTSMQDRPIVQETEEYRIMKERQYKEIDTLLNKSNTKRQRRALATKHHKEFMKLVNQWANKEARKQ